ncbi:MAG: gliding motility-associated-like protein [Crocinitomix sp.]|jgi:gliding motility-associated-like protein
MKGIRALIFTLSTFIAITVNGQIVSGNGYLIGDLVEIAVHGNAGHEGTLNWDGHHARGGTGDVPFGFVANPAMDGWGDYNGDYFTAGTPENGFGIEINGTNYSNNGWNSATSSAYLAQIPTAPGGTITHTVEENCITVEWEGAVAGVTINVKYHLITSDLFYTTEITLTNGTGSNLNDFYYYRNVDPDNNEALTGVFETTNTIVSQPSPDCIKALVSAEQATPWPSYLGIGGLGEQFRVTHGGFSNRSGSDIWNAAGGLNGTLGSVNTADQSISLAYKADISAGATVNFSYAVVLNEASLEAAFSSLYFINYETSSDVGGGLLNPCSPSVTTVNTCRGNDVLLTVNGPDVDGYTWVWSPGGEIGDTLIVSPDDPTSYTVIGTPTSPCLVGTITKYVNVVFSEGPLVDVLDQGFVCMEFNLDTLLWENINMNENTTCIFLTEEPDSAGQVEPEFDGPVMTEDDLVWLVCYDSATGCYDYAPIDLNWLGPGSAGDDTSMTVCGGPGTVFHLGIMISDSANNEGYFEELTDSGGLIDSTGLYNGSGIYGTFVFWYITPGLPPCLSDTAVFTVTILERPNADFNFIINGVPSTDGVTSGCITALIEFENTSTIIDPGVIVEWYWSYGDGEVSEEWDAPSHTYTGPGTYVINLGVISDNGCVDARNRTITIYDFPPLEVVYQEPICFGYENGLITVIPDSTIGPFDLTIEDEDGNILNDGGVTADSLGEGTYFITIEDQSGCVSTQEITLEQPPYMDVWYRISNPACMGDSGWVVVDSVAGESDNNPISYTWDPNPANIEGIGADSSFWMKAGDYTLTVTDSKGCFREIDLTLIDPPPFYFTDWGWDTAYCRLYGYQSGNGFVWAAAAGGVPTYNYEWTYLYDGSTSNNTTWGARNPGDHLITITDAFGCQLTKIITVDSVNPIASFTTESAMLNEDCEGTADVEVLFTNMSQYYANPNNPDTDTLFMWDMDRISSDSWTISHDFFEQFDTTYEARGASYQVDICLIAFNKNGCKDTACKTITIWEPPVLDPVNVFTPNGNGTNDVFTFKNFQKGIHDFNCIIVNRWGVKVGEINEITGFWNGTSPSGDLCPNGVYFYTYVATADNGEEFSGQGTVTLLSGRGE